VPGSTTHLVPVAGLDVIGRPLTGDTVHRPEIIAELAGIAAGDVVTPEVVATVLAHPAGGAKGLPDGARFIPFLNKAHDPSALAAGRAVGRRLDVAPQVDAVVLGAVGTDQAVREVWGWAGAVVLAAGQGRRFGSLKQVQPWRGLPLVAHVVSQALHCPDVAKVVVTVGAEAEMVTQAAREAGPVTVVRVPDWAEGQSRSVQTGLSALQGCSAALFLLADQPAVTPELLSALIQRHRETLAPIVAPRYAGQRGNPVLFDAATFPEFVSLHGDIGARPIIRRHEAEIAWLDWPSPDILSDIDTRADYDAAFY
jgi:molybdenum cofactor cytidylyltransferase